MQSDDIYRFVGLRQPSPIPPGDPHDPVIGAYTYKSLPADGSFRHKLTRLWRRAIRRRRARYPWRFSKLSLGVTRGP